MLRVSILVFHIDRETTYKLPLGRKDSLGENLFLAGQLDLVVIFVLPVPNAKLVHCVEVEDPIEQQGTVPVVCVVYPCYASGNSLSAAEEDRPAEPGRIEVDGLNKLAELYMGLARGWSDLVDAKKHASSHCLPGT